MLRYATALLGNMLNGHQSLPVGAYELIKMQFKQRFCIKRAQKSHAHHLKDSPAGIPLCA
jgi:hypothetical protein